MDTGKCTYMYTILLSQQIPFIARSHVLASTNESICNFGCHYTHSLPLGKQPLQDSSILEGKEGKVNAYTAHTSATPQKRHTTEASGLYSSSVAQFRYVDDWYQ